MKRYLYLVALAVTGCGRGAGDREVAVPTWTEYLTSATRHFGGAESYVIDGDVPVSLEDLRVEYSRLVENTRRREYGVGRTISPATVNLYNGAIDRWSATAARNLTYCISNEFGALKDRTITEMEQASQAWEAVAEVDFRYHPEHDGNCTGSNSAVRFAVRPWTENGACAFFPHGFGCEARTVLMNYAAFTGAVSSLGGFRHELGHVLGLRHEHVRVPSAFCSEDPNWSALTAYDGASVMHYPQCPGSTNSGDLTITALDAAGVAMLYPPTPFTGSTISNQVIGDFAGWSAQSGVRTIAGDFNGDGLGDVALVGGSGWVSLPVAFGNGAGGFSVTNYYLADFPLWAQQATSAAGGDFDADGDTDIALFGGSGWTTIPIAFSTGGGGFSVTNYNSPNIPFWAQATGARAIAGDFDADGDSDIALSGGPWTSVPVAFSNRNGTFSETNYWVDTFPFFATANGAQIVAGDFDGDGDADLAAAGGSGWASVPVAFSQGNGGFTVTNISLADFPGYAAGSSAKLVAGDFDGDGDADLAAPGGAGGMVPFALSSRDGSFTPVNFYLDDFPGWAANARSARAGRFNADGRADIVALGVAGWTTMPVLFLLP